MSDSLRNVLIRVYDRGWGHNYGNVVVAEALRRRVEVEHDPVGPVSMPGIVLIDADVALGAISRAMRMGQRMLVVIRATDEFVWTPVRDTLSVGDYHSLEMVPWVEYLRACSVPDEFIIQAAHKANEA